MKQESKDDKYSRQYSRAYYLQNRERLNRKSRNYWKEHSDKINKRRRDKRKYENIMIKLAKQILQS
ncbi:MAG: hypothetical protein ACLFQU_13215 [Candidatus Kapaibacterium sp.]